MNIEAQFPALLAANRLNLICDNCAKKQQNSPCFPAD